MWYFGYLPGCCVSDYLVIVPQSRLLGEAGKEKRPSFADGRFHINLEVNKRLISAGGRIGTGFIQIRFDFHGFTSYGSIGLNEILNFIITVQNC